MLHESYRIFSTSGSVLRFQLSFSDPCSRLPTGDLAATMRSVTLVSLGFLGLELHAVSSFHIPVPVQAGVARNMRSSATALSATEGTSESLHANANRKDLIVVHISACMQSGAVVCE